MKGELMHVTPETVVGETAKIKVEGYRFVTITAVELDEKTAELIYHFDKNLDLKHFRLKLNKDVTIPSVSSVYLSAFLVENEIQDLFGIHFNGIAIDYKGTLYMEGETFKAPFCKYTVKKTSESVDLNSEPKTSEES